MEKKINLIVTDEDKNLRVDVFINKKENDLSRTRVKNLILNKKLNSDYLNIGSIESGMYFVQLTVEGKISNSKLIIK